MASRQRTEFQMSEDLTIIADKYRQGWKQNEIAIYLSSLYKKKGIDISLCRQQIGYDIKKIIAEWREERLEDIDDKITSQLAKSDYVQKQAHESWLKSIRQHQKTKTKAGTNAKSGSYAEESIEEEEQIGDPRFLAIVNKCIEETNKIMGIYTIKKDDSKDNLENEKLSSLSDAELNKSLSDLENE